ncbi:MAG: NAD(P)/FAD-dependent oxidoreductase [Bacteroidales bacterium]|jgi:uncharacterized FAD-dependent dehydrogenase|nr:NAD(P)/FAD-dependent oxidoreductase [Bacteroidales bacterium]
MYKEIEISIALVDFGDKESVKAEIAKAGYKDIADYRILRRSIDARKTPCWRLKVAISDRMMPQSALHIPHYKDVSKSEPVLIIGAGPAGLFAALRLIECGFKPVIIEKGNNVTQRKIDIANIIKSGTINTNSNWCYGEGGAGTFSDGKLYTRSNKRGNITKVLETFVAHGADEAILYDSNPHIGTDNLSRIIKNIRTTIENYGGEYHFNTTMTDIIVRNNHVVGIKTQSGDIFDCNNLILACGHSARDVYSMFCAKGWLIETKPFAMGVRIEHPQHHINSIQYHSSNYNSLLPPASYRLAYTNDEGGVFSFCMCPGGIVIPASTEYNISVVNGMSNSSRLSPFANAGIVVSVNEKDVIKSGFKAKQDTSLLLMEFQQASEASVYAGNVQAFGQRLTDFINNKPSSILNKSSYLGGLVSSNLNDLLPHFISTRLRDGFMRFDKKMRGFITEQATLISIESRTSSPVRIPRDPLTLQHLQIKGLYPCGEGAGYAGGITSSAIDGINVADNIAR